ncbi:MAG: ATP-binding cassette domain-containing protein [Rhodospirillaceae bacterium]
MGELIARMIRNRSATAYLMLASLVINVLGLMSSLYVIQVLNRYVSYGVTGTLASLTLGVVIAIGAEHVFRRLRLTLAEEIVGDADERLATGVFGLMLTARVDALEKRPAGERAELVRGIERAEQALGPANLTALADLPFSALFLLALALLSAPLALVAVLFCAATALLAWRGQQHLTRPLLALGGLGERVNTLINATIAGADTLRHFHGAPLLMARWRAATTEARATRAAIALSQHTGGSLIQAMQALMGAAVIAVGAVLVVLGQLDVGALIGANLIAARALAPLTRLVQMGKALATAQQSLAAARAFAATTGEPEGRKTLSDWSGRIELDGVGLVYPGAVAPLFSALRLALEPGSVLVISGRNGTGKSSLLRLIAGLIEPSRGQIRIDGVDLRQISLDWWRRQVSWLPQEPVFLEGSLRENLAAARPDADEAAMLRCLAVTGLQELADRHPAGLDQPLAGGGRHLAPGLRRRLAMARAILVDGRLVLLDEPSEGLDREGAQAVYSLLIEFARRGKTLVVISHDPVILGGAKLLLRFDGGEPALLRATPAEGGPA